MGYHRAGFEVVGVDIAPQPKYPFPMYEGDALWLIAHLLDKKRAYFGDRHFGIEDFDAIHASPPCQAYTLALNLNTSARKHHPDLVGPTRDLLAQTGLPWIMENVPNAPMKQYVVLCGTMFHLRTKCGAELRRHRLFETNWEVGLVPCCQHGSGSRTLAVTGSGGPVSGGRTKTIAVYGDTPRNPAAEKRKRIARTISVTGSTAQRNIKTRVVTVAGEKARGGGCNYAQTRETFNVQDARDAMGIDWLGMKGLSQAIPPDYTQFLGERLIEHLQASKREDPGF